MREQFRELRLKQLDRSVASLQAAGASKPARGWLRAIREAIGISSTDLAKKLGISRQLALQQEKAEAEERITLRSLRALAAGLDCDLVYALVPRAGNFEQLVEDRARTHAKENVLGVEHTMRLEDQAAGNLEEAIQAEAQRLSRKRSGR